MTHRRRQDAADRTRFELPDDQWDAFVRMLNRETRAMPGLVEFLARPSVFDKGAGADEGPVDQGPTDNPPISDG